MCGIFGFVGNDAYNIVKEGLNKLQYRGYDSCGIAYYENKFHIEKIVGEVSLLKDIKTNSKIAFGHTRWATNGAVTVENAHPHKSYDEKIIVVHNGIIKNSEELKTDLISKGVDFYSDTDTEVIANFIAYYLKNDTIENVLKSLFEKLDGSFSLIVADEKADLYLIKKFSPLNLLINDKGIYVSSDISSLDDGKLYSLKDYDIIKLSQDNVVQINGSEMEMKPFETQQSSHSLGCFSHFMQKEIFETPESIKNTYENLKSIDIKYIFENYSKITLIGCGTAYHSCLIGEYFFNEKLNLKCNSCLASNYNIKNQIESNHLHIIVSQSGETADCIKIAEKIKENKGKFLIITNEQHSTIAKMADYHIFTKAKKEIAVASTKTYCCQVFVFAYICKKLLGDTEFEIEKTEHNFMNYISTINVRDITEKVKNIDKMVMIAKDVDYLTMLEASLKIREIDYIFTIPMYAGELKHGTLSLIEKGSIVLSLNTSKDEKNLQNAINEIESRGGVVVDFSKYIPKDVDEYLKPIYAIIPFQLLSYEVAVASNRNPDMPRNLAKSVTVE